MSMLYYFDLFGVAVFAVTGALMAGRKSMDLFGVVVIGLVTALGGGTLRDVILAHYPVGWTVNAPSVWTAVLAALGTVLWVRLTRPIHEFGLLVADAFGLAVFTATGTNIALQQDASITAAVIMGVMTGVAGGVLRDVICNEIPLIFKQEIYALACMIGALVQIGLLHLGSSMELASIVAMGVVFSVRMASIHWKWTLPRFHLLD
ncbi:trimeric intracellular cation channel family protein [Pseudomonas sp. N040]|uniref:trimeric intracellular cation channel family protein n=1 Tax=Pseudomonas sp. N040 TaxID=2785325 RepID=UPI0018A31508|nr:trimeric intracellular cation channel family protein [Pseudomonas sp. N040]MBF7729219.1 trimeric intracellular cation channel family protein [Pseudomonas sp. N040]MBW7012859.1 trimeric intracellular cation channel family protein [Pseudomonas sp. N040]